MPKIAGSIAGSGSISQRHVSAVRIRIRTKMSRIRNTGRRIKKRAKTVFLNVYFSTVPIPLNTARYLIIFSPHPGIKRRTNTVYVCTVRRTYFSRGSNFVAQLAGKTCLELAPVSDG
jgi:hypothetical protein